MLQMYVQGMMERLIKLRTGDSAFLETKEEDESVDSGEVSNKSFPDVV